MLKQVTYRFSIDLFHAIIFTILFTYVQRMIRQIYSTIVPTLLLSEYENSLAASISLMFSIGQSRKRLLSLELFLEIMRWGGISSLEISKKSEFICSLPRVSFVIRKGGGPFACGEITGDCMGV